MTQKLMARPQILWVERKILDALKYYVVHFAQCPKIIGKVVLDCWGRGEGMHADGI